VTLGDGTEVTSRAVILATGVTWRRLGVPSLEALVGTGVFYGAATSEAVAMKDESPRRRAGREEICSLAKTWAKESAPCGARRVRLACSYLLHML
jgi:hypothetical protein